MNTNYQVVLKGVRVGYLREDVAKKVAPLFKISIDEAGQMLDQLDLVLKNGIDFQTAVKYVEALEICGCTCEVQPEAVHPTEVTSAAQPSIGWLNERDEHFELVNETSVSGTTRVAEESKWTVPKISERGKKFVIYGLVGSVLIASVGYGAFVVYEAREKRLVAEKENLALERLASVKPSTFYAIKLETKYPAEKPDVLDWSKISAKSELLNQVLAALQSKDDTTLASFQFEFLSTIYPGGASYELPPGEGEAFSELHDLIEKQPGLALELAEASKRILSNQQIHKADDRFGWYNFPDAWYELAMVMGSRRTLEAYVEAKKHERDYAALYELYGGGNEGIEDTLKAAEYFGLAVQSGNTEVLGVNGYGLKVFTGKGPQVASAAREAILKAKPSANAGTKNDLVKVCRDLSSDILDPLNGGKGVSADEKPGVELEKCGEALLLDKNNKDLWYQYGYALERNAYALRDDSEFLKAKIAYARAAELGHPMAIARFWSLDFVGYINPRERAIKMLQAEAAAGNPWGNYFLGKVFSNSIKDSAGNDSLDYEKSVRAYLKAIDAGLVAAYIDLGAVYFVQKKYDLAIKSYQQASDKFPRASLILAEQYEKGGAFNKDLDLAKKWYKKASGQGVDGASDALARLENSEKVSTETQSGQPKYSAETVAGKFEIINIDKDGGELVYKLGGKVVTEVKEMLGATAEIHDVYNLNDRTLLVVTWNINNSKIGPYKFSTFFIDIDKNGNFSEVFDKGIPTDEKHIDVVKSPEKLEFKIRVESDKVGYQRVVFDGNGARQISDWKWVDENREKERQQQSKFVQQNNPGIDVVGTYANNVAAMVEQSPNLACLALANNIRSFGNSGAPANVRERQVEAMIDKLPNICIPSGLR